MLLGQLQPHRADGVDGAQFDQYRLGLSGGQSAAHPARCELGQQPVQSTHRLGAQRGELLAAV
jgi:hypothetical protein